MLQEREKKVIMVLQGEIPLTARPYQVLAEKAGLSETEFLQVVQDLQATGRLRRIGAVLQHRKAGFMANGLCAWVVPRERLDELGAKLSAEPAVSHCYVRKPAEGWPYNFYAMLHATTRAECEAIAERLSLTNGLRSCRMLYSVREWKKASMQYFRENQEGN